MAVQDSGAAATAVGQIAPPPSRANRNQNQLGSYLKVTDAHAGILRTRIIASRQGYDSFFYSIQLSLRKSGFDSTHDSQWLNKN